MVRELLTLSYMETCKAGKRALISSAADRAASGVLKERFVCLSI